MTEGACKSRLALPRRRLVEIMQAMRFGRIEDLVVRHGEPVLDPLPRVVRAIRLGKVDGPCPKVAAEDFLLKGEVRALFDLFDREGSLLVEAIEVQHGLPHRVFVATRERS